VRLTIRPCLAPQKGTVGIQISRSINGVTKHIAARDVCMIIIAFYPPPNSLYARRTSDAASIYSSIVLTHSQPPRSFSFHKLTRLSPPLTASTLPAMLQLHRHTTTSNSSTSLFQLLASA
jgi:hypothetical protein